MAKIDFDYREIDDAIHGRVRLAVMAYLSGAGEADFVELRDKVGGTDGNLLVHLRKLEGAGYIRIDKARAAGRARTICRMTGPGRSAWIRYIKRLEALIDPAS
jgi:DNA-binding MarR family transcriptional regulator